MPFVFSIGVYFEIKREGVVIFEHLFFPPLLTKIVLSAGAFTSVYSTHYTQYTVCCRAHANEIRSIHLIPKSQRTNDGTPPAQPAQCLADIKVTPNGRFYPGTHERVVLVVGEPPAVQLACDRIVTTIYTAADTSLDITQRVLIPDAASGLIIGHDGGRLGDLRQEAGVASIQV